MRYLILIGFIFLNIPANTETMQLRGNYSQEQLLRGLVLVNVVLNADIVQDNQPELRHVYNQPRQRYLPNQQDKKSFNKISNRVQPKKGYAAEKRLLAPRTNKKSKK